MNNFFSNNYYFNKYSIYRPPSRMAASEGGGILINLRFINKNYFTLYIEQTKRIRFESQRIIPFLYHSFNFPLNISLSNFRFFRY